MQVAEVMAVVQEQHRVLPLQVLQILEAVVVVVVTVALVALVDQALS